ncbi:endo alpha-1,4 polygalactosaminidase [Subtercola sp. RTI3]|nr:endo alpha-1,4 polygalactosaminidase [Subtercola sp. RTI3]
MVCCGVVVVALTGCAGGEPVSGSTSASASASTSTSTSASTSATSPASSSPAAGIALPPAGAPADYQLGGAFPPASAVMVVTRDSTAPPAPGLYSICYVNAFQSQPGVDWPSALVLHDASGAPLRDPGWPDESIFDTSTAANRTELLARLTATVSGCSAAGYRAVEFDNLDSYTRSNGALTVDDALAFATQLVTLAHTNNLAAGQKNAPDLAARAHSAAGFDFAVAEECIRFAECEAYAAVYGENVIDIEYAENLGGSGGAGAASSTDLTAAIAHVCATSPRPRSTMVRDHSLTAPGSATFVDQSCAP